MTASRQKRFQAFIVILMIAAIILAGSFAWYSFSQQALNIFEGFTNPDVNLHDDYEDGEENKDVYVENSGERPLYVRVRLDEYMEIDGNDIENIGGSSLKGLEDDWYTHIYAGANAEANYDGKEYHDYYWWTMGGSSSSAPIDAANPNAGLEGTGDVNEGWKYYLPAPFSKRALFDTEGKQIREPLVITYYKDTYEDRTFENLYGWTADMTDPNNPAPIDYINNPPAIGAFEASRETLKSAYGRIDASLMDTFGDTAYDDTGSGSSFAGTTNLDYLNWLYEKVLDVAMQTGNIQSQIAAQDLIDQFLLANGLGYWDATYEVSESYLVGDDGDSSDFDPATDLTELSYQFVPIKRTLAPDSFQDDGPGNDKDIKKVYTMEQWIKDGMPSGKFWVMDTDGWCYWADVLLPGDATSLLLSNVELINSPSGVWYYGINAKLEAVTYDSLQEFSLTGDEGIQEMGLTVLQNASGEYVFDMEAGATDPGDPVYTFMNHGDGVYSRMYATGDGDGFTFGPRFVYTGDVTAKAMGDIYTLANAMPIGGEYKIGATFTKDISSVKTAVKFTIAQAVAETGSPIVEGKNGRNYIKLTYDPDGAGPLPADDGVAWLAVGADGKFNKLTGAAPNQVSNSDDILVWTNLDENDEFINPGTADDRYQEEPVGLAVKIGDAYEIDGIEWLVIGKDQTDSDATNYTTMLVSKDLVDLDGNDANGLYVAAADVAAALTDFTDGATGKDWLPTMEVEDAAFTSELIDVEGALKYFANNAARAADSGKWWLGDDYIIDVNGSFLPADDTATDVGLRVAVTIKSDALNAILQAQQAAEPAIAAAEETENP